MPTIVELPDKTELEFPDGMDEMAMRGAISKHFPQFAKPFPSERATLPAPGQTIATHAALDTQPTQAFPVTPAQPPERRPAITTTMQDALMSGVRQEPPPPEAEIEPIGQPGTILHGATSVAAGILNRPEYLAAMMNPATAAAVGARFLPGVAKQFFEDLGKATRGDNEALGRAAAIGIPALIGGVRTGRTVTERLNAQSALERARSASSQSHIDALSRLESTPTAAQQQPTILKRSDAELAKIPESEEEHAISQRETEKVPVEVPPGDRGTVGAQVREQAAPQEASPDDAAAKEAAAKLPRDREEELLGASEGATEIVENVARERERKLIENRLKQLGISEDQIRAQSTPELEEILRLLQATNKPSTAQMPEGVRRRLQTKVSEIKEGREALEQMGLAKTEAQEPPNVGANPKFISGRTTEGEPYHITNEGLYQREGGKWFFTGKDNTKLEVTKTEEIAKLEHASPKPAAESEAKQPAAPEPESPPAGPVEPAGAPARDWDAYYESLVGDLDSFSPARQTGKRNYEMDDVAQRFVDYAKQDKSGKPLSELVNDFAKSDEASASQIKKLKAAVKNLETPEPTPAPAQAAKGEAPAKPEVARTTPAPNTPERETWNKERSDVIDKAQEAYSKMQDLRAQRQKTSMVTKKYETLGKQIDKADDAYSKLKGPSDKARAEWQQAGLEDVAGENIPIASEYAAAELEARKLEASGQGNAARKLRNDAWDEMESQIEGELRKVGLTEAEAKDEGMTIASMVTSYPLAESRRLNERFGNIAKRVESQRGVPELRKEFDAIESPVSGTTRDRFRARMFDRDVTAEQARKVLSEYKDWVKEQQKEADAREKARSEKEAADIQVELLQAREWHKTGNLHWIAFKDRWAPVEGKPVKLPGVTTLNAFIRKTGDHWTVTEERSGMAIGTGKLRADAIKNAAEKVLASDPKLVENQIVKAEKQLGPRPKIPESTPAAQETGPGITEPAATFSKAVESVPVKSKLAADLAEKAAEKQNLGITALPPIGGTGLSKALNAGRAVLSELRNLPKFTEFKRAINRWFGENQKTSLEVRALQKDIESRVPTEARREAITNYLQADGDVTKLDAWAKATKDRKRKAAYETAKNLTPDELKVAQAIRQLYDDYLAKAQSYDLVDRGIEDYVTQVWRKPILGRAQFAQFAGKLASNFRFGKQRTFENFFEGEQAGYKPVSKDISKLVGLYVSEMGKTIATRDFIKDLTTKTAEDGRPLAAPSGNASVVQEPGEQPTILVRPDAKGKSTSDYAFWTHPALQKWKWVATDPDSGGTVLFRGDLRLHPDIAKHVENVLTRSAIKRWYDAPSTPLGVLPKALVKGIDQWGSVTKQVMLGFFAPFHHVQEATHAIGHHVNPLFDLPKLDPADPAIQRAMDHSLALAGDNAAMQNFREGVGANRVFSKIPIVGEWANNWSDFLFHEYIPKLKLKTYNAILERNKARYADDLRSGAASLDDVEYLSAQQTNAAYGHLNYADIGRDPTVQHIARALLLAPDFLEARTRFTGQALKGLIGPQGREQLAAIATLAATFYVGARILNKLGDDNYHWDEPFGVVHGGRTYTMRSVPEDIWRAFKDSRRFIYGRVSPIVGRGAIELLTGRNFRGERTTALETMQDLLVSWIPITLRNLPGFRDLSPSQANRTITGWESFLGAMGVQVSRHSPISKAYQLGSDYMRKQGVKEDRGSYPVSKYQQLRYALEDADTERAVAELKKLAADNKNNWIKVSRGFQESLNNPWTKSRAMDTAFKQSLSKDDKMLVEEAENQRRRIWGRFTQARMEAQKAGQ